MTFEERTVTLLVDGTIVAAVRLQQPGKGNWIAGPIPAHLVDPALHRHEVWIVETDPEPPVRATAVHDIANDKPHAVYLRGTSAFA